LNGTTIFLVEQNANLALKLAGRGYVMENDRILYYTKIHRDQKLDLSRVQGRKSDKNLIRFFEVVEQGKDDSRGFSQSFCFYRQVKGGRLQACPDKPANPVGSCLMDVRFGFIAAAVRQPFLCGSG
jgi:energy-coupling factor transporter ATP-binding protein EcfA2